MVNTRCVITDYKIKSVKAADSIVGVKPKGATLTKILEDTFFGTHLK